MPGVPHLVEAHRTRWNHQRHRPLLGRITTSGMPITRDAAGCVVAERPGVSMDEHSDGRRFRAQPGVPRRHVNMQPWLQGAAGADPLP